MRRKIRIKFYCNFCEETWSISKSSLQGLYEYPPTEECPYCGMSYCVMCEDEHNAICGGH